MKKILVAGLINIETTVAINWFPIEYTPIDYQYFGVKSTVSGVGYNVAKVTRVLSTEIVNFRRIESPQPGRVI